MLVTFIHITCTNTPYRYGDQFYKYTRKHVKYNKRHSQNQPYPNVEKQDHIDKRSTPTSQPTNCTTNSVDCAVKWLLFRSLYFFMVILLYDTTLQVQEISQKSTLPKWTQLNRLDNRSYSTIQIRTYPTYIIMRIEVCPTILEFFNTFSQKSICTAHHKSHQTCNEVETSPSM